MTSPASTKIFSISELTRWIRETLEDSIGDVRVEGEISNLKYHTSGHVYFTLKDADSQLTAVIFRGEAARLSFRLKDGMKVQGHGRITVYERRGNYQIIMDSIQPAGTGNLQAQFEALKKKLQLEGLFDPDRKRSLPTFPRVVGVVTSPQGAALRDFCNVLHRRFPGIRIILAPASVQGSGAAREIAAAIDLLNLIEPSGVGPAPDVIAIIRGGGSLEDLWAFNEEITARAVARSRIPTLSGVGHEVDFTICDFVADLRAPTPSAAAEMIIRPRSEFIAEISGLSSSLHRCARLAISDLRQRIMEFRELIRSHEPRRLLRERRQQLDDLHTTLQQQTRSQLDAWKSRWMGVTQRFQAATPRLVVERKKTHLTNLCHRLAQNLLQNQTRNRHRLELLDQRMKILSPQATLERGYSITLKEKNQEIVRSASSVRKGDILVTLLKDGKICSEPKP